MLTKDVILNHYKKKEIQDEILALAESREISVRYPNMGYGKRPDIIQYPSEVLSLAKSGASSFHASVEHWHDPMNLRPGMLPKELLENRKGWDLVLDIDCPSLELAKHAAVVLKQALDSFEVPFTVKFSGRSGFHFGIAFETFPDTIDKKEIKAFFPEKARTILDYLNYVIKKPLAKRLLEHYTVDQLAEMGEVPKEKLTENNELNPFVLLVIDKMVVSSRHLYRMPYSLHEKSGLVSLPLDPEKIMEFQPEHARPDVVTISPHKFLQAKGSSRSLFIAAFDRQASLERQEAERKARAPPKKEFEEIGEALPEELFPPCMINLQKGIEDGKKRAMFTMVNFLRSVGWGKDRIEEYMLAWNKNNDPALREAEIKKHVGYHCSRKEKVLPANCDNANYYTGIGICQPDGLCNRIKNPVQYVKRKKFLADRRKEEEEKEAKKKARKEAREKKEREKAEAFKAKLAEEKAQQEQQDTPSQKEDL